MNAVMRYSSPFHKSFFSCSRAVQVEESHVIGIDLLGTLQTLLVFSLFLGQ